MKAIAAFLFRQVLRTRYSVSIKSPVPLKKSSATLILPNHPAEVDPVIISSFLWAYYNPRPVVLETIFQMPGINSILKYIHAIPMPDMEQGSGFYKRKRIQIALKDITSAIKSGKNILIYPSGRLSLDGREILGGASGIHSIVSELKDVDFKILLVRTSGLWGSRFSKAQTDGQRPDILSAVLSSVATIFKNLIFFVPKRKVELALKEIPAESLRQMTVSELNNHLQTWYNQADVEELKLIKNCFWQKQPVLKTKNIQNETELISLPSETENKILEQLTKVSSQTKGQIKRESLLSEDLGLDSLVIAELVIWLHEELEVSDLDLAELRSVNDIYKVVAAAAGEVQHHTEKLNEAPKIWHRKKSSIAASISPSAQNLAQAIISKCKQYSSQAAFSDPLTGVKNYKDLLRAALLFRLYIQKLEGDKVAILLPASATVSIISLAVWLSGKTPVYLNWTAGIKNLKHCLESLNIKQIITAGSVLDKINSDLTEISDSFLLLEEIKAGFGVSDKLQVLLQSMLPEKSLFSYLNLKQISKDDTAAILFTSGSESAPKTVPLTHKNIMTNVNDIFSCFEINESDVLFGFLPPFHSFGLTVTTILPLVGGLRVAFYPNPNDSRKIALNCYTWGITIMAGTPSFLRGVLSSASVEAFKSLRVIMSGAEKLPEDLKEITANKASQACLLEGYGITECSPVVCAQRLHIKQIGVGACLPSVQLKIVDNNSIENGSVKELKDGETGLVLINGPSVFNGYLASDKNPFVTINGELWYNSGDLGYLQDNCLVLEGRLKRFVKIGGEMISLPAIEETLQKHFNSSEQTEAKYQFSIVDKQEDGENRVTLILFSNFPDLTPELVNEQLKLHGFTALSRIKKVIYKQELPTLGSGKVDFVSLASSV